MYQQSIKPPPPTLFILLLLLFGGTTTCLFAAPAEVLVVSKEGLRLDLALTTPKDVKEVELRFYSSRNRPISKKTDVAERHPQRQNKLADEAKRDHEIWYPVVDLAIEPGLDGIAEFETTTPFDCIVNAPYWMVPRRGGSMVEISSGQLEYWENSIRIDAPSPELKTFYLRKRLAMATPRQERSFNLLSGQWSGRVELYAVRASGKEFLGEAHVESSGKEAGHESPNGDLNRANLLGALRDSFEFTMRCQNQNPNSPSYGGLQLFYDLEAKTYRCSYWMWGWGPSVRFLLEVSGQEAFSREREKLQTVAREIGECSLRHLWFEPGTPFDQIALSRYLGGKTLPHGFQGAITFADSLFLAGWAWLPLYERFGEKRYLDLTRQLVLASDEVMDGFEVIPHSYYVDSRDWTPQTIDECGFGMEGYAEAYRTTRDPLFRTVGQRFLKQHIDLFEQPNGGWARRYNRLTGEFTYKTSHARGQGWAMEGLLAAYRLMSTAKNLERCRNMADNFVEHQREGGYWTFEYDQPVSEAGISEKGTALWSWLLYQTYNYTKDAKYLDSARKALNWCLENRYAGPDEEARGSIIGTTNQSAVFYRPWFQVSCSYTTAFFGLALLEELKLQEGRDKP
ncbi:MAG: glycoside hydrolase family 88 protein [Verrucomicrobiae bacterium]|nr:glycoside hydrolase family 88 protein [Verrucomicrobiae bacterium]